MKAKIAILSFALLLAACGAIPSISQNEREFRINIGSDPSALHPAQAIDPVSSSLLKLTMDGLTRIGRDGTPTLAAAKEARLSEDRMTYTFILRDLQWSNGEPVTAADFEYAWKWALNPENKAKLAYQLYPILNAEKANNGELPLESVGIEAVDERSLVVKLENPAPYFLELVANPSFLPIPSRTAEKDPDWAMNADTFVSNGPFLLSEWERGDQIVLEKNEHYWDAERVHLERVIMTMIDDVETELSLFNKGALDWTGAPFSILPDEAIEMLKQSGKLKTTPIAGAYELRLNTEIPPFDHPKIRKALAYAIDRQTIVDSIAPGRQWPATAYVPPTMFPENKQGRFRDYNLEEAKRLFAEGAQESGMDRFPSIELAYQPNEAHAKLAKAVKVMWERNLGLDVVLKEIDWETQLDEARAGNFQIVRISWIADFNDAVNYLDIFAIPEGSNVTSWTSDEFNRLIVASYKETDEQRRIELLQEAEKKLLDEMPSIPIYFYTQSYATSDRVEGVYVDPFGNIDLKWATTKQ